MTGIMAALIGAGGSPYVGSTTVTVGTQVFTGATQYGKTASQGSASPSDWAATGFPIFRLCWTDNATGNDTVNFTVTGSAPNSGWTTMTIDGTPYARADATYTGGVSSTWVWVSASNPFGTTNGATKSVVWS